LCIITYAKIFPKGKKNGWKQDMVRAKEHCTHKYVLARGRERDRLGGVCLLDIFSKRELITRLYLCAREERRSVGVGGLGGTFHEGGDG
jgi:hypothetical protein